MACNFDSLFDEVLQTEKKAREERDKIAQLRSEYANHYRNLKTVLSNLSSISKEVKIKEENLAEKETEKDCLFNKVKILCKEKKNQEKLRDAAQLQLENLTKQVRKSEKQFCENVTVWDESYGLCSNGQAQREQRAKEAFEKLQLEEKQITKELVSFKEQINLLEKFEKEKSELQENIAMKKEMLQKVDANSEDMKSRIGELEKNKLRVSNIPNTDPEFLKLRSKIASSQTYAKSIEKHYSSLQHDLTEFKQRQWQQNLRQKRELEKQQRFAYQQARTQPIGQLSSKFTNFTPKASATTAKASPQTSGDFSDEELEKIMQGLSDNSVVGNHGDGANKTSCEGDRLKSWPPVVPGVKRKNTSFEASVQSSAADAKRFNFQQSSKVMGGGDTSRK